MGGGDRLPFFGSKTYFTNWANLDPRKAPSVHNRQRQRSLKGKEYSIISRNIKKKKGLLGEKMGGPDMAVF